MDQHPSKTAILLINIGTPSALSAAAVRRYLRQFLMDPRVIDKSHLLRWLLVNGIIVPFRHRKTLQAYAQIWQDDGSPLMSISHALRDTLQKQLGCNYEVALGMRYGQPSIQSRLETLLSKQPEKIIILPLFPQYSSAANGSAIEEVFNIMAHRHNVPHVQVISSFHDAPWFIEPLASLLEKHRQAFKPDCILFSYHGLPEHHTTNSWAPGWQGCDLKSACPSIDSNNQHCYRAQCFATSRHLSSHMGLQPDAYQVSFQSRLGRVPWIKPYTDILLPELYAKGHRRLMVASPSFTADCLETLEEIQIRTRAQWLELGGEDFHMVPCLNTEPMWIERLGQWLHEQNKDHTKNHTPTLRATG